MNSSKSVRQVFDIVWSISQNQASHDEINWARRVIAQFIVDKVTFGLLTRRETSL